MDELITGDLDLLRLLPQRIQQLAQRQAAQPPVDARPDQDGIRRTHTVRDYDQLSQRATEIGGGEYLVEGILQKHTIGILVGDSGLGKSPLLYQMAMCIAAGIPFLGRRVTCGPVLYMDFENGLNDTKDLVERLAAHLALDRIPPNLQFWHFNDCSSQYGSEGFKLLDIVQGLRPVLVIIDSLGAYNPDAEEKNSLANRQVQELRGLARLSGSAILCVHHLRKLSSRAEDGPSSLEGDDFRNWFQQARGPRALINGTDMRLGVDLPRTDPIQNVARRENVEEPVLALRGFGRMRGDTGVIYLGRALDDEGEPLGYNQLIGARLLFNADQENALAGLNQTFTFGEAKSAYGRRDQATTDFLKKCMGIGLVRKTGRGQYEKLQIPE